MSAEPSAGARVTVLLLSVDEAPMLALSLPAAVAAVDAAGGAAAGHRVVVIDNACTDGTAARAAESGVTALRLVRRLSYAAAMNAALAASAAAGCDDAVLMLNADCVIDRAFLAAALPRLRDASVGAVAPKLLRAARPSPEELAAASPLRPLHEIDAAGMSLDRRRKNGLTGHGRPSSAHAASAPAFGADGAAALYRRATLTHCAIGAAPARAQWAGEVLDEDMALWASDADLAWRAQLLGWRCVYEPAALALHVRTYSPSTRAQLSEQARRVQFRNRLLMIAKNETAAGLRSDGVRIAAYEVLALGHALLRERPLLGGYREAAALLPRARARRRLVQAARRVDRPPFGIAPPP